MVKDGKKTGSFSLVVLTLLVVSIFLVVTTGLGAKKPDVFLTNRANEKILKPYYQMLSFKPLTISLDDPRGIACGPDGLLYVAETSESRIVRFTQQGGYKEEVLADEPGSGFSGEPLNLTFGPNGNLFFITPQNGIWTLEDGDPKKRPEKLIKDTYFDQGEKPHDLGFLKAGEYSNDLIVSVLTEKPYKGYVARIPGPDYNQVRPFISRYQYTEMGNKKTQHLRVPVALAVNDTGEVFIADHEKRENHVLRYSPDGEFVDVFVESIVRPMDLNFDSSGKMYATLGPLWRDDPSSGGLKVYGQSGSQEMYIPRQNIWGTAICKN
ncbi:MAG: hypothetical protein V5A87_08075 [Candidatus Bipolaricaulota bacterium]|nr:hypothetical protein [Candidatus Bipolaricaulota bacterium]